MIIDGIIICIMDLKGEIIVLYSLEFYVKDSLVLIGLGIFIIYFLGFFFLDDYVIYNCVYFIIIL